MAERFFQLGERIALEALVGFGFEARLTGSGRDGGIDVEDLKRTLAVQVKVTGSRVGSEVVQRLYGASPKALHRAVFASAGFTGPAIDCADDLNVGLFQINFDESIRPLNRAAEEMSAGQTAPVPQPTRPRPTEVGSDRPRVAALIKAREAEAVGDLGAAEPHYRKAAVLGDVAAMRWLAARLLERGNEGEAAKWTTKANQGAPRPEGVRSAEPTTERNDLIAREARLRRAAVAGDTTSMVELATSLRRRGIQGEAQKWLERAAQIGHPGAQAMIGRD